MENATITSFFNAIIDDEVETMIVNLLYLGYSNEQILEELINFYKNGGKK